ncbi:ferredoxin, 2fe-2s-like protein [Novymonas esmeraldas]|uniref:Ferredoxin, 2fe-2s-like protein n=1 Tax=Novymonas esmeraldas TaxID=1808958 RepID=A0AAW0F713_9TRYP
MWRRCAGRLPPLLCGVATSAPLAASHALYSTPGKIKVHVKKRDGSRCDIDVPVGISLMQALRDVARLDVEGTCDGEMVCATCHVYLSETSFAKLEGPSEDEEDVLAKALDVKDNSRLACQVDLTPELDGLEVELPSHETHH